jgi:hypothetical protein
LETPKRYVSPVDLAGIYAALGGHERALTLLEGALREHDGTLLFLREHREFDPLRDSPRFNRILREVGAP